MTITFTQRPISQLIILSGIILTITACRLEKNGGVRLAHNMEKYAINYIEKNNLLKEDEKLIAYYDYTLTLNGKTAAILTNKRYV